ncbi:MAG: DoxX family protein [Actinomycetota bacterium]
MSTVSRILTYALGLFLISSGVAKFTGGHVFQYIEFKSGLDIFYPYVNHATGAAEILVGVLVLIPATRLAGAIGAAGIMAGAIGFHLSPWLGVSMPTGLTEGAAAPWTAADFAESTTSVTFALAIVAFVRSLVIARSERRRFVAEVVIDDSPAAASVAGV